MLRRTATLWRNGGRGHSPWDEEAKVPVVSVSVRLARANLSLKTCFVLYIGEVAKRLLMRGERIELLPQSVANCWHCMRDPNAQVGSCSSMSANEMGARRRGGVEWRPGISQPVEASL